MKLSCFMQVFKTKFSVVSCLTLYRFSFTSDLLSGVVEVSAWFCRLPEDSVTIPLAILVVVSLVLNFDNCLRLTSNLGSHILFLCAKKIPTTCKSQVIPYDPSAPVAERSEIQTLLKSLPFIQISPCFTRIKIPGYWILKSRLIMLSSTSPLF